MLEHFGASFHSSQEVHQMTNFVLFDGRVWFGSILHLKALWFIVSKNLHTILINFNWKQNANLLFSWMFLFAKLFLRSPKYPSISIIPILLDVAACELSTLMLFMVQTPCGPFLINTSLWFKLPNASSSTRFTWPGIKCSSASSFKVFLSKFFNSKFSLGITTVNGASVGCEYYKDLERNQSTEKYCTLLA